MIRFTENCESAISSHGLPNFRSTMMTQLESYTSANIDVSAGTQDQGAQILELKLKALILDTIHNIEVIEQLNDTNVHNVSDWQWQKQLRLVVSCILTS